MKFLLVGGGGREHAIAKKLVESELVDELLCAPGNAGIRKIAKIFPSIKATDLDGIVKLSKEEKVDFVVVAPDDPLSMGLVDRLEAEGIAAFGPTTAAARYESSKDFSKEFMLKYNIPTARYRSFEDAEEAIAYIREQGAPIVVKCDGLALGKGVVVAQTVDIAIEAVKEMLNDKKYGESGALVVIEECMAGPEITQLAFCDGEHIVLMPSSQDHKRAFDNDLGPNTGGMGAIAPCPLFTDELRERAMKEIFLPTIEGMRKEGTPFRGVLYFGLMLTEDGPKVIEYNARFGDPETQAVLPLLKSDLARIFIACREGTLDQAVVEWDARCCACVVVASGGYPAQYATGFPITGLELAEEGGAIVYHAGTKDGEKELDGAILTAGGRVLGVSVVEETVKAAVEQAYLGAKCIYFEKLHMRRDIGKSYC